MVSRVVDSVKIVIERGLAGHTDFGEISRLWRIMPVVQSP